MSISPEFITLFKGLVTDYNANGKGISMYVKSIGMDSNYPSLLEKLYNLQHLIAENDGFHEKSIINYLSQSALILYKDNPQFAGSVSRFLINYREITKRLHCLTDENIGIEVIPDEHPLAVLIAMQSSLDLSKEAYAKEIWVLKNTIGFLREENQQLKDENSALRARIAQLESEQESQLHTIERLSKVNTFLFSELNNKSSATEHHEPVQSKPIVASSLEPAFISPPPPPRTAAPQPSSSLPKKEAVSERIAPPSNFFDELKKRSHAMQEQLEKNREKETDEKKNPLPGMTG